MEADLLNELTAKQWHIDGTRALETNAKSDLIAECHAYESNSRLKAIDEVQAAGLQVIRDRNEIQLLRDELALASKRLAELEVSQPPDFETSGSSHRGGGNPTW